MRATQLPYQFKTLGVLLLVLAALIILLDHTGFILSYYQGSHQFGKTVGGAYLLPADYVRASFYIYQIVPVLTIASFMLIVFSKQKIEDEWIKQKRLIAYKIAFFCGPVLTLLLLKVNYEMIVAVNLVLLWLIQYVVFIYLIKIQPYLSQKFDENRSA